MNKPIDLVVTGMDLSGTSTQVDFLTNHLTDKGLIARDLRGTEFDALFHSEIFSEQNQDYSTFKKFLTDHPSLKGHVLSQMYGIISDLRVASMVRTEKTSYIDPKSADVWILEEPTRREAGQNVRVFELCRSDFGSLSHQWATTLAHQAYRSSEFYRFRKPMRDNGKIIIRSRSEESCAYQIRDVLCLPEGVHIEDFILLPGNEIAFRNPPTHIFVVNGPADMTAEQYRAIQRERNKGRIMDDYERDVSYQLLVNRRYATEWLEEVYKKACCLYGSREPQIIRFPIETSIEEKKVMMNSKLDEILSE